MHDGSWTIYYIFLCQWRQWEITSNKITIPPFDKTLMSHSSPPNQPRVLLLAPTGTAAVIIVGTAIHSLSEVYRSSWFHSVIKIPELRNYLSEIEFIIVDEISVVSNDLFYQVHARLLKCSWLINHLLEYQYFFQVTFFKFLQLNVNLYFHIQEAKCNLWSWFS